MNMVRAGIEAMNIFGGSAFVEVAELARHRKMDSARFENLLMKQKAVALPCEDAITFGVNAARPIIAQMSPEEQDRIEMLITCSESGIDFGKSLSTYIHHYLQLNRNCRLFEIKQACYSGTAGLQMANNFVLSQASPGAKALVIATDISRLIPSPHPNGHAKDWSYAELSGGAGAVAILISETPFVFQLDLGGSGYYGYEVMDTCRPMADIGIGSPDLSLLSYLDCCEQSFLEYQRRVAGADYRKSFDYLVFHTPFGGMVKGAHRTMMRKMAKANSVEIESDFRNRVEPGMIYCQRMGNVMGGTIFVALASIIDHGQCRVPCRVGCFSYGSGCCSEFYSGVITSAAQSRQRPFVIEEHLNDRYQLSMNEYEEILRANSAVCFGTRNAKPDIHAALFPRNGTGGKLVLNRIQEFHREYEWLA